MQVKQSCVVVILDVKNAYNTAKWNKINCRFSQIRLFQILDAHIHKIPPGEQLAGFHKDQSWALSWTSIKSRYY